MFLFVSLYINLIKKAPSFDIVKDIYEKLLAIHFEIDMSIYYVFLWKCQTDKQVEYVLELQALCRV